MRLALILALIAIAAGVVNDALGAPHAALWFVMWLAMLLAVIRLIIVANLADLERSTRRHHDR